MEIPSNIFINYGYPLDRCGINNDISNFLVVLNY